MSIQTALAHATLCWRAGYPVPIDVLVALDRAGFDLYALERRRSYPR